MAFTRAYLYARQDQKTSHFAKALCHPARLTILRKLYHDGPCTVESLTKLNPLSQPAVSQHLEILRKLDLVKFKEVCPYTFYQLNRRRFFEAKKQVKNYFDKI
jgi:DNA-binding transcriptional ArsR family regulator